MRDLEESQERNRQKLLEYLTIKHNQNYDAKINQSFESLTFDQQQILKTGPEQFRQYAVNQVEKDAAQYIKFAGATGGTPLQTHKSLSNRRDAQMS